MDLTLLPAARHLVFHGAIVLLIGLLCGAPYGRAINRDAPAHTVHAWRVAHASLPMGAALMFGAATALPLLAPSAAVAWCIAGLLIASGYSFCLSLPLAALTGHRGLRRDGPGAAQLVYLGNLSGAVTSLLAAAVLAYAAYCVL